MNKLGLSIISIGLLASCSSSDQGELVGVQNRPEWFPTEPYGMVFVPSGSYNMGHQDPDVTNAWTAPTKTVSVTAFYMDETEITNNEYRQFVHWVRDSIARYRLAAKWDEMEFSSVDERNEHPFGEYAFNDPRYEDGQQLTAYQEYLQNIEGDNIGERDFQDSVLQSLNWEPRLYWDPENYPEEQDAEGYIYVMESMYLPHHERFLGRNMIDARQLNYVYFWLDRAMAARKSHESYLSNRSTWDYQSEPEELEYNEYYEKSWSYESFGVEDRSSFFKKEIINIYPDTLVWVADFSYSFNDPMHDMYFWHPAYDDYPVVGVNWKQAGAFCNWRSKYRRSWLNSQDGMLEHEFRLPTEGEWEYASRGGYEGTMYPWGGPYATTRLGCYTANFKPMRGNLTADGGFYPIKVATYDPNGYGLFDMGGNVSEWTSSAYAEESMYFLNNFNPDYRYSADDSDLETLKRKVIRGGSWKDIAFYMQNGTRDYEYQDTAKSFIGFRTVQNFLGRDPRDF